MSIKYGVRMALIAALVSTAVHAESEVTPDPGDGASGPGVTIIQRDQDTIHEYRAGNQLYMIKVVPKVGAPYFLVDTDGDGNLETRRNELDADVVTPQWVLFRWR